MNPLKSSIETTPQTQETLAVRCDRQSKIVENLLAEIRGKKKLLQSEQIMRSDTQEHIAA